MIQFLVSNHIIYPISSDLSALFDAIESLLFPMMWQHTLIPALPPSMIAFLGAPTPYLIGVLVDGKYDNNYIKNASYEANTYNSYISYVFSKL